MLTNPLILKRTSPTSPLYSNGKGQCFIFGKDHVYAVDHAGEVVPFIKINKNNVSVLDNTHRFINTNDLFESNNTEELTINSFSQDQKNKGIGILDEEEKVRTVAENGSCSDGGASEPNLLELQESQFADG